MKNKKIFIIICVSVVIIIVGYFTWQGKMDIIDLKETVIKCIPEGELISTMPLPKGESIKLPKCCDGLEVKPAIEDDGVELMDVNICVDCPNGECGLGENQYNCPEDCK